MSRLSSWTLETFEQRKVPEKIILEVANVALHIIWLVDKSVSDKLTYRYPIEQVSNTAAPAAALVLG